MENRKSAVNRQIANPAYSAWLNGKLVNTLAIIGVGFILNGAASIYREARPIREHFFETGASVSPPQRLRPLTEQVVTQRTLLLWARDCAVLAYDVDYYHYAKQQADARQCFTDPAWEGFSMASRETVLAIISKRLTARPVPIGNPELIQQGIIGGRYAWRIQMPLSLQWENNNGDVPNELMLDMTIIRSDDPEHARGIAFSQFVAKPYVRRDR